MEQNTPILEPIFGEMSASDIKEREWLKGKAKTLNNNIAFAEARRELALK